MSITVTLHPLNKVQGIRQIVGDKVEMFFAAVQPFWLATLYLGKGPGRLALISATPLLVTGASFLLAGGDALDRKGDNDDSDRPDILNPTIQTFVKGAAIGTAVAAFIAWNNGSLGVPYIGVSAVLSGVSVYGPRKLTHALAQRFWPKQDEGRVREWLIGPGFWKGYEKFVRVTSFTSIGGLVTLLSGGFPYGLAYPVLAAFGGYALVFAGKHLNKRGWDVHKDSFEKPTDKTFRSYALWGGAIGLLVSLAVVAAAGPVDRLQTASGLLTATGACALTVGSEAYLSQWILSRAEF